jgi:hypothetical protein
MKQRPSGGSPPGAELLPESPPCPFCGLGDTELMSAFGGQLSVATYWCLGCGSPFEFMKWSEGAEDPTGPERPS